VSLTEPNEARKFPERDENWVTGRVRLMECRVEVAERQRKVLRIDVFQRGCQPRQVSRQKDQPEREGPRVTRQSILTRLHHAICFSRSVAQSA
jgi:hypothetical protein